MTHPNHRHEHLYIYIWGFVYPGGRGNPVKAEIVNWAEDYRYSSAIDWAGGKGLLEVTVV